MKDIENHQEVTVSGQELVGQYSRTGQSSREETFGTVAPTKVTLLGRHRFYLLLFSLLVGGVNVALPILQNLANVTQSQYLYTGLMLTKGLLPYGDMFATGGILYYVLVAVSYLLGSSAWLVLAQVLAVYISGAYFYRLVAYFTSKQDLALVASLAFYLLNLSLGFGGLYPLQFAQPLVLIGLWFLTKHLDQDTPDESLILYGLIASISVLIEPRTLIFWFLSAGFILFFNGNRKQKAIAFYQLLCLIFGSILVLYSGAYFLINLQILGPYLSQALVYRLTVFSQESVNLWQSLGLQLFLALAGGLLLGLLGLKRQEKTSQSSRVMPWFISLMLLLSLPYALLAQTFAPYVLLDALVFGLLLTVIWFHQGQEKKQQSRSHRRLKQGQVDGKLFGQLLKSHAYLPVLVFAFGLAYPIWQAVDQSQFLSERVILANYLKKTVLADEKIYVWDSQPKIYADSQLTPSSQFLLPVGYTASAVNRKTLEDELLQNQANYIVVNQQLPLSQALEKDLQDNYQVVKMPKLKKFTLYQLK